MDASGHVNPIWRVVSAQGLSCYSASLPPWQTLS